MKAYFTLVLFSILVAYTTADVNEVISKLKDCVTATGWPKDVFIESCTNYRPITEPLASIWTELNHCVWATAAGVVQTTASGVIVVPEMGAILAPPGEVERFVGILRRCDPAEKTDSVSTATKIYECFREVDLKEYIADCSALAYL